MNASEQDKMWMLSAETRWADDEALGILRQRKEQLARAGRKIYDLSMINPDLPPQRSVIDRLVEATLQSHNHRYSVARGVRKLRDAFCTKYERCFGVRLSADTQVCVTLGAKDGLLCALRATCNSGDTILMGAPTYPSYLAAANLSGLKACFFQLSNDADSTLRSISDAFQNHQIRALVLNFPNNPTGQVVSKEFYTALSRIVCQHSCVVINDFVYGEMCHSGAPAPSILAEPSWAERAIEVYSLSKAYGVPGWRIGAVLGASSLVQRVARLKANLDYGIFLPLQFAACHALTTREDLVNPLVAIYNQRVKVLAQGLQRRGWALEPAQAGVCVWAKVPDSYQGSSLSIASELLERHGLVVMPGALFGAGFERSVRLAAVLAEQELREVVGLL